MTAVWAERADRTDERVAEGLARRSTVHDVVERRDTVVRLERADDDDRGRDEQEQRDIREERDDCEIVASVAQAKEPAPPRCGAGSSLGRIRTRVKISNWWWPFPVAWFGSC